MVRPGVAAALVLGAATTPVDTVVLEGTQASSGFRASNSTSTTGRELTNETRVDRSADPLEERCVQVFWTDIVPGSKLTAYSFATRWAQPTADADPDLVLGDQVNTPLERNRCTTVPTISEPATTVATVVETPVQPSLETKVTQLTELVPVSPTSTNGRMTGTPTMSTLVTSATVVAEAPPPIDVTTHDGVAYAPAATLSSVSSEGAAARARPGFLSEPRRLGYNGTRDQPVDLRVLYLLVSCYQRPVTLVVTEYSQITGQPFDSLPLCFSEHFLVRVV